MSLLGALWLVLSLDIVQVERGWSGVIAGSVLLGSGGILMGLAALLHELGSLRAGLAAPGPREPGFAQDAQMVAQTDAQRNAQMASGPTEPAPLSLPKAPPPDFAYEPAAAPPQAPADHWKNILARTHAPQPQPIAPGAERDGRLARRYESQGVRYSLFDDGTIEAETESGAYSFASIEELRAFLDARKAARGG